ncbi:isochorismatase [Trichophyton equinum CBS 127.97]|uniref:Isochorismatase n=1 Tax=Trichophyton equinum (strain ATCC MYA-4606 / CBS 127.97) TaxID=559882 RepID=F2Q3G5_TRIEC|nr:isochorismatase [Trichophyton equinum CBS 127.97]
MAALDLSLPTVLLIIDNHTAFDNEAYWGKRSNPQYKENVTALINAFRDAHARNPHIEVIHIGHSSTNVKSVLHPYHPDGGPTFYPFTEPMPDELVFWKNVNSALVGTDLEKTLRAKGVRQLLLLGLTAEHCVSTTTRMAANLGVTNAPDGSTDGRVILVEDATASFPCGRFDADTVHGVSVATLKEFAEVVRTADVLRDLQPLLS